MKHIRLSAIMVMAVTFCMTATSCDHTKQENTPIKDSIEVDGQNSTYMTLSSTVNLNIYTPSDCFTVDLVCGDMPSQNDESVLMCCEAAFTGQLLDEFKHSNIAGNHVSSGTYHKGYRCKANTGCFAFYPNTSTWKFAMGDYNKHLIDAAGKGGCGFGQAMVIYNGQRQARQPQKLTSRNYYRVLADYKGKLSIIDSKNVMKYDDFVKSLIALGVTHALYLDMGTGWNYSFYRDADNQVQLIHRIRTKYATNWVVFKKK